MDYSQHNPEVVNKSSRLQLAKQILSVIKVHHQNKKMRNMKILDIGCSSGIISLYISRYCKSIVGVDNDKTAIRMAKKSKSIYRNCKFELMDVTGLRFPANSFDIVICNQVYECVDDPERMLDEIYRVLKKGGTCFFGAVNKYALWENQYKLPIYPMLPDKLQKLYLRILGRKAVFKTTYLSYNQLKKICRKFHVHHYTPKILRDPSRYNYEKFKHLEVFLHMIPLNLWKLLEPLSPNFIWILEKN